MAKLQILDKALAHAVAECAAQHPELDFTVTSDKADVKITITDNNLALLLADGHEIESYELPLRLANLMADLMWLSARRREDAEKSIPLNSDFILEPRNFRLLCGGIAASLTGREVALLQFMLEAGECSKELLLARVWHYHPDSTTHTVETHLWRLRQKLQTAGISAPLIITTENGYRIA
ncbi:MAG TPA: hypothetical protein DIS76_04635 [Rhodospirillaceae bacterium]|nr:hypothetical protein [Rhodospirillaceae bacterium]